MEIRIGGKVYEVPDACDTDGPKNRSLKRHLSQHGAESFLSSQKYGQFAPCILEDLKELGAEVSPPEPEGQYSQSLAAEFPSPAKPPEGIEHQKPDS